MTITKFKPSNHLLRDVFFPGTFNSLAQDMFGELADQTTSKAFFRPTVDIVENENSFDIHVSIPGVKKDEIVLDVKANELIISGERKERTEKKDTTYHVGEIRYGKFSRSFYLPEDVNKDKIEAKFEDGVLHVVIPKAEKAKPKSITIK